MEAPLVSVIIPCYNQAQYLDECLSSVLSQTYKNWECLIINASSPDNAEEIATKWTKRDSRFSYFKKENKGLSADRNYGIALGKGVYILPLDADDKIDEKYIELGINRMLANPTIGVLGCRVMKFGMESGELLLPTIEQTNILYSCPVVCSSFFLKDDWKKVNGYDEKITYGPEDWDFWISLIMNTGKKIERMNYIGFYYRIKETSMLKELMADKIKKNKVFDYILKKHYKHYLDTFGHPIEAYAQMMSYKERTKFLEGTFPVNLLLKIKRMIFGRKNNS